MIGYVAEWSIETDRVGHQSIRFSGVRTDTTYDGALRMANRSIRACTQNLDRNIESLEIKVKRQYLNKTFLTIGEKDYGDDEENRDQDTGAQDARD